MHVLTRLFTNKSTPYRSLVYLRHRTRFLRSFTCRDKNLLRAGIASGSKDGGAWYAALYFASRDLVLLIADSKADVTDFNRIYMPVELAQRWKSILRVLT
jgi:hypothetical protein